MQGRADGAFNLSMRLIFRALVYLGIVFSPLSAIACSCSDLTPRSCNLLAGRDEAVFIGTVVSVENPPREGDEGGTAHYRFRVQEWLSADVGAEVEVSSGRGGADCSFWFETGIPYLVFAYRRDNGDLWATICSNTQRVVDAGPLPAQLRAMRTGRPVARVYGTLRKLQQPYEGTFQSDFDRPLGQVVLHFESSKKKVAAKTADDGSFAIYNLAPGTYRISAELPPNLELAQTILSDPPPPLQLDGSSCVQHDLEALPTGKIRGQLIGNDLKPVWNTSVELFSVDRYTVGKRGWWEFVDDKNKYFEFEHVAPGEYFLVFNNQHHLDTDAPYPRTFFRDAPDPIRAERIRLVGGEQLLHTDIHLSGGAQTRKIKIRVVLRGGGEPASSYLSVKGSQGEDVFPSPVAENLYELNVLPDSQYSITAHTIFCDPETESDALTFVGASAPLELTINVPDTKCTERPPELRRTR
jgi:hypothetical protein